MPHSRLACGAWMQRWARGFSGCQFAAQLAGSGGGVSSHVFEGLPDSALPPRLTAVLRSEGAQKHAVLFVFPDTRTPAEVASLVGALTQGGDPRWQSQELVPPSSLSLPGKLLRLTWETDHGRLSPVMGLGPFGTLPVTRRAPYVGLMIWPGHEENPFYFGRPRSPQPGQRKTGIGLPDMPTRFPNQEEHDAAWEQTEADVAELTPEWAPLRAALRETAFCLDLPALPALSLPPRQLHA